MLQSGNYFFSVSGKFTKAHFSILTISIVLLAIGDKIKGETIGTLLGGISVYILQNSFGAGNENKGQPSGGKPIPTPDDK